MPTLTAPDAPSLPEAPVCSHCNRIMRLQSSAPAQHYDNLDQFRYVCACGWAMDKVVAHAD